MPSKTFRYERSAGGLVFKGPKRSAKLLMVRVRNLLGEIVWTFPKGHLEKGETDAQAAVREVLEETGWDCGIESEPFEKVLYWFKRGPLLVKKEVVWFLMRPVKKTGRMDPDEILQVKWVTPAEARKKATYPSDKKLLEKLAQARSE